MIPADPLAPAVQVQLPAHLVPWQRRIANEPEVGFESDVGERFGQTADPAGQPTGASIGIGPLKRENVELIHWQVPRRRPPGVPDAARCLARSFPYDLPSPCAAPPQHSQASDTEMRTH